MNIDIDSVIFSHRNTKVSREFGKLFSISKIFEYQIFILIDSGSFLGKVDEKLELISIPAKKLCNIV